jgi:transcription elongation factor Elf1
MIDLYEFAADKVRENIHGRKKFQNNGVQFRCPFCGDSKKSRSKMRGWLMKDKGGGAHYHCYNCQLSLGAFDFVAALEHRDVESVKMEVMREYKRHGFSNSDLLETVFGKDYSTSGSMQSVSNELRVKEIVNDVDIPEDWVDLEESEDASKIVRSRRIMEAPFVPKDWKLYYDKKMSRIAIPWIRGGKMVYHQLRKVYKKQNQKYLFPKETNKDVFGLDGLDPLFQYVFYCEGVFDAVFVKNCVAIGGLTPTKRQLDLIRGKIDHDNLVLFSDNPWMDESSRTSLQKIAKKNARALVWMWNKSDDAKDVNELVLKKNDVRMFADEDFLRKNIVTVTHMNMMLKFNRMIRK